MLNMNKGVYPATFSSIEKISSSGNETSAI